MEDPLRGDTLRRTIQGIQANVAWVNDAFDICEIAEHFCQSLGVHPEDARDSKCYTMMGYSSPCSDCPLKCAIENRMYSKISAGEAMVPTLIRHHAFIEKVAPVLSEDRSVAGVICWFDPVEVSLESGIDFTSSTIRFRELQNSLRLAQVVENASDGIIVTDTQGKITYVNPAFERMSGYTKSELINTDPADLISSSDVSKSISQSIRPLALENGEWRGELKCRRRNGEIYPIETRVFTVKNQHGEVVELAAIQQDISERYQAEQEIQKYNERFRNLVKNSSDVIVIIDQFGRELFVSDSVTAMTGYTPEEVLYQSGFSFLHPDDVMKVRSALTTVLKKPEKSVSVEYRHRHKEGGFVDIEAVGTNYLDVPSVRGIVLNLRDVTERKLAEQRELQLQNKLIQAHKMESIGRLAGGVAHDFNNILSVIIGYSELALDKLGQNLPVEDDLKQIQRAAHRSADLTRQLLAFARKQEMAPKIINLNMIIENILMMLERLIGNHIRLEWFQGESLWQIKADPTQIEQILTNLVVNARDAISGNGTITIETKNVEITQERADCFLNISPGEFVVLKVSDDGCGIEEGYLEKLFEPFFTTKPSGQGTGLGLSTVYGIVKQNAGAICVTSDPGEGTVFRILLPRFHGEILPEIVPVVNEVVEPGCETILIVEDVPEILNLIDRVLKKNGFRTFSTTSPQKALEYVHGGETAIDLLLTDVVMPEMNGQSLSSAIRKLNPQIKCLYMSGYSADIITDNGVLNEQTNFIRKPFSLKDLIRKVRDVLDAPVT